MIRFAIACIIGLSCLLVSLASADIDTGLVAYYPFDGDLVDASGNGNHGVASGDISYTSDHFGNQDACLLLEEAEHIDIGAGVKPSLPLTVAAWVRLDGTAVRFRNDTVDNTAYRYGVYWRVSAESFFFALYSGFSAPSNRRNWTVETTAFADGGWHHVAAVITGSTSGQFFIDGVEHLASLGGTGPGLAYSSGSGSVGHSITSAGNAWSHGCFDELRVYDRALTTDDVAELYQEVPTSVERTSWSAVKVLFRN